MQPVWPITTEIFLAEKNISCGEKYFSCAEKYFLRKKIFLAEKIYFLRRKIYFLRRKNYFLRKNIFLAGKNIFLAEKNISCGKKIFLAEKYFLYHVTNKLLAKIHNARNHIYGENFKLNLCTCAQSMALGTHTKFQLGLLIRRTICATQKFRENILESLRNVSETPLVHVYNRHRCIEIITNANSVNITMTTL